MRGMAWTQTSSEPERWQHPALGTVESTDRGRLMIAYPRLCHHVYSVLTADHGMRQLERFQGKCMACWAGLW